MKEKKVTIYTTTRCPKCHEAMNYFKAQGIHFVEFNIEKNRRGAKEFERLRARGVPVILVNGQRIDGFDKRSFDKLYRS